MGCMASKCTCTFGSLVYAFRDDSTVVSDPFRPEENSGSWGCWVVKAGNQSRNVMPTKESKILMVHLSTGNHFYWLSRSIPNCSSFTKAIRNIYKYFLSCHERIDIILVSKAGHEMDSLALCSDWNTWRGNREATVSPALSSTAHLLDMFCLFSLLKVKSKNFVCYAAIFLCHAQ